MPIPIPLPEPAEGPVTPVPTVPPARRGTRPYYLRDPQDWATEQERQRHTQALYQIGEWVYFLLMWTESDYEAGLVARCSRCFGSSPVGGRIAAVYEQPTQNECPVCFGTTFEGGWRARIVRPAMITDVEERSRQDRKGTMHPAGVRIQTTVDFRIRNGDYLVRADNSRWQLAPTERVQVRTGFQSPGLLVDGTAYASSTAKLEERTTVAYKIPPTNAAIVRTVLSQRFRVPADFAEYEELRGPLLPPGVFD